jgi:hypothetical protein
MSHTVSSIGHSEQDFLRYMGSRQYQPAMANFIIKNSPNKNKVKYMGSYYIADNPTYTKSVFQNESDIDLDVIYTHYTKKFPRVKIPSKDYGLYQGVFTDMCKFAEVRKPPSGKTGAYLLGEIHDKSGFVHWNLMLVTPPTKTQRGKIQFFDPAYDFGDIEYEFFARQDLTRCFNLVYKEELSSTMLYGPMRPQQLCQTGRPNTDMFCQTWSLMFLDVYCNNKEEAFFNIDFKKYHTAPVKSWVFCLLKNLAKKDKDPAADVFTYESTRTPLESFPFTIKQRGKSYSVGSKIYTTPSPKKNCINAVMDHYSL